MKRDVIIKVLSTSTGDWLRYELQPAIDIIRKVRGVGDVTCEIIQCEAKVLKSYVRDDKHNTGTNWGFIDSLLSPSFPIDTNWEDNTEVPPLVIRALHISYAQRDAMGLVHPEKKYALGGEYQLKRTCVTDTLVIADKGAPSNYAGMTESARVLLHETAHGISHLLGRDIMEIHWWDLDIKQMPLLYSEYDMTAYNRAYGMFTLLNRLISKFKKAPTPVKWIPSPNFSAGRNKSISGVVIHSTEGTSSSAINWLSDKASQVSAHYIVCENGDVIQMVREEDTAWHAGRTSNNVTIFRGNPNDSTIGIEFAGYAKNDFTPAQYNSGSRLIRDICTRHNILLSRGTIVGHREIYDRKTCPGDLSKIDKLIN